MGITLFLSHLVTAHHAGIVLLVLFLTFQGQANKKLYTLELHTTPRGCSNLYSFSMFTYLFTNFARRTATLTEKEPLRGVDYQTLTYRIREKQQHIPATKQDGQ